MTPHPHERYRRSVFAAVLAFQVLIALATLSALAQGNWAAVGAGAMVLVVGGGMVASAWEGTRVR